MLPALLAGALALLGGGAAVLGHRVEARRQARLHGFAAEHGWTLTRRDDVWATAFTGDPFGRGSGRRAEDVLLGRHGGRDLVAFSYSYRTTTTDGQGHRQTTTHRYAVLSLRLPAAVPTLQVEPASWLPRVFDRGIELESEAFGDRYRVRCEEPRFAYDVLPARTMQLLLDRPEVSLRLYGGVAVAWERGTLDPFGLSTMLDTLAAVLDGVPSWVWSDRA